MNDEAEQLRGKIDEIEDQIFVLEVELQSLQRELDRLEQDDDEN